MEPMELDVLERLAGLIRIGQRRQAAAEELQIVHHDILEYLSRCNRYSDTMQALTDYLGLTKGTVSQSVKLLERKGYLVKTADIRDGRVQHLCLAEKGREYIWACDAQTRALFDGIEVNPAYGRIFLTILKDILWQLQMREGRKGFMQCRSCRHNRPQEDGTYLCGLTLEALSADDVQKICREHGYPA